MASSDDVLHEFLVESHENLDRLDRELVELERDPDAQATLASIFRTIHTIKGTSGFFGFEKLGELTHAGESLLSKMRDGELRIDDRIAGALLQLVDAVREMLASIETSHDEGEGDYSVLIAQLGQLLQQPPRKLGEVLICRDQAKANDVADALAAQAEGDRRKLGQILVEEKGVSPAAVGSALDAQRRAATTSEPAAPIPSAAEGSVRVDTAVLDRLMNLAGELVLARNQMMQLAQRLNDPELASTSQRLNLITSELREGVMRTRMQPIGHLLAKLPRVVRDLAVACGKQVQVELEGQDTDLDRAVLEGIKDPLTHLIRNAVDHGIEPPDVRVAAGKPAEGKLRVRAFHESGQVNIEIVDDGGGIDPERVAQKAVERGLVSFADAQRMGDRERVDLIFLPGFSTAATLSTISGRGVGMDVVKTNVQRLGGTVEVHSTPRQGTSLRVKIPLTLAIIPALIVKSAGDRYAIPQTSVQELLRVDGNSRRAIEQIHGAPVYRLRGQLLPLVYLDQTLASPSVAGDAVNIVVVQAEQQSFGLVVDEVIDTEEIVVKPLDRQMMSIGPFAGATILGDGRVVIILDVRSIVQQLLGQSVARPLPVADEGLPMQTLLLLRVGDRQAAVPLHQVARLEEFDRSAVERAGQQEAVQYRGRILPLVRMGDSQAPASDGDDASGGRLQVVVHTDDSGHSVGLIVDRVLDIVREPVSFADAADVTNGSRIGSAIIARRVTELLDVGDFLRDAGLAS